MRRNWTRNELIVAFNLYCKIPFSKINYKNEFIIKLANAIERTPSAVAWKLVNFASLDPSLTRQGIKGASNASKLDNEIFQEFNNDWESLAFLSERLIAEYFNEKLEDRITNDIRLYEGIEKKYLTKVRINQSFFRSMILSSYDNKCCLTGIEFPNLLVASHIIPWSKDKKNRLNPRNGLCLNYLHDKAFDKGLITFDAKFSLKLSSLIKKSENQTVKKNFIDLEDSKINLPKRFLPDQEFLEYHRNKTFMK